MKRVCLVNVSGLSPRLLSGAGGEGESFRTLAQPPGPMKPTFPVVRASVQASMTTGAAPGAHGVLGGGVYRRQARSVSLEERSNTLLTKKRFWHARSLGTAPKVALVFWSNPLAGAADFVLGSMTYGCRCGRVSSQPVGLYEQIVDAVGEMDISRFQGPGASWRTSEWIADAAVEVWNQGKPELMCVTLPGLDYEIVRHGLDSEEVSLALKQMARITEGLVQKITDSDGLTVVVSDGGYVNVSRVAHPNVCLREAGLLETKRTECGEVIDFEKSRAFAMADHQVAQIYCNNEEDIDLAAAAVAADEAIDSVVSRDDLLEAGLGHDRAGERIALADPDAWISYRWWAPGEHVPACAEYADCGHKGGYDPCELMSDGKGKMDLDESRVRASRGLVSDDPADWCLLAGTAPLSLPNDPAVTDLPDILRPLLTGRE
ncbi:MAG: alkaline phosphatase family protein [Phycisphaerae bacterium]